MLRVTFDPSDSTILPSSLQLTFADSFTVSSPTCNSFVDFTGTCSVVAPNTIQVSGTFTNSAMSFSVNGITAPTALPSDYSSIITQDSSGYKIDQSDNDIIFALECTLPCRSCPSDSPNTCNSCYSDVNISDFIYFDNTLNTCNEQCVDGKYENTATLRCSACDDNCLTC